MALPRLPATSTTLGPLPPSLHHCAPAMVALLFWEHAKCALTLGTLHFCPEHSSVRDQMVSSSHPRSNVRCYVVGNSAQSATSMLSVSLLPFAALLTTCHIVYLLVYCLSWTAHSTRTVAGFCLLPSLQLPKQCLVHTQSVYVKGKNDSDVTNSEDDSARCCSNCFTCINPGHPPSGPMTEVLLFSPYYEWEN